MANGLYVEVLSAEAWEEPADSLRALMESDNLDQLTGLADHEIHLLEKVHTAIGAVSPGPGESLWPAVWRRLSASAGSFLEDDRIHVFNFAMGISAEHLAAVKLFHFHSVIPQALRVEPRLLGWLAAMPPRCPPAKVAVLCHGYMVDPRSYSR